MVAPSVSPRTSMVTVAACSARWTAQGAGPGLAPEHLRLHHQRPQPLGRRRDRRRQPGRTGADDGQVVGGGLGADTAPEQLGQFGMGGSTSTRPVRKTTTAAGGRPGRPPGAAGGRPRSRGDGTGTASLGRQPGGEQVVVDLSQRHGPHRRVGRGVVTPLQPQDPFGRRVQPMSGHQELHPGHLGHLLAGEHQGDLLGRLREPMEDGQSPGPGTARRGPGGRWRSGGQGRR